MTMTSMAASYRSAFKSPNQPYLNDPPPRQPASPSPPSVEPLSPLRPVEPTYNYPPLPLDPFKWPRTDPLVRPNPAASKDSTLGQVSSHTSPVWSEHFHQSTRERTGSSSISDLADAALTTFSPTPHRYSVSHTPSQYQYDRSDIYRRQSLQNHAQYNTDDYRPAKRIRSDAGNYHHLPTKQVYPSQEPIERSYPSHRNSADSSDANTEDALLLLGFAVQNIIRRPSASDTPRSAMQSLGRSQPSHLQYTSESTRPFAPSSYYHDSLSNYHDHKPAHHYPTDLPSPQETNGFGPNSLNVIQQYHDSPEKSNGRMYEPQLITPPAEVRPTSDQAMFDATDFFPKQPSHTAQRTSVDSGPAKQSDKSSKTGRAATKSKRRSKSQRQSTANRGSAAASKRAVKTSANADTDADPTPLADFFELSRHRRNSHAAIPDVDEVLQASVPSRSSSVPPECKYVFPKETRASRRRTGGKARQETKQETICAGCQTIRSSASGGVEQWISCNGCDQWFHADCAGFLTDRDIKLVDKFFCESCEPKHGPTTFVRKSGRAHAFVDYAGLNQGVLKTSDDLHEHHYIQSIKDGTFVFEPDMFPRVRPELVTADYLAKMSNFVEPLLIPAEWNPHPLRRREPLPTLPQDGERSEFEKEEDHARDDDQALPDDFEYQTDFFDGQDSLDMVIPQELTIRRVCDIVGPDYPLEVIDVKEQNPTGGKWNLAKWADYYEASGEKPIRNVISLEVSDTRLGKLLRRPKVVRDLDLQDHVWPADNAADQPKSVAFYCLMSVADSYTDFHIDFGGSSVYYHILRGKKTFFFIPPKEKHLKAYEAWNNDPQQNFTFLGHITKECYRVDLYPGDTMLIPSGWIHAVWTPENSLVIGGNFLTRMHFPMQLRVCDIERANGTPLKFRYPKFQRLMFFTALDYLEKDPIPGMVRTTLLTGGRYAREIPAWQEYDETDAVSGDAGFHARYYSQMELEGLPELLAFLFRTVMITMGRVDGITAKRRTTVTNSMPKMKMEPIEVTREFALWVAWKRGNEELPAWACPDAELPDKEVSAPKKTIERATKALRSQSNGNATHQHKQAVSVRKSDDEAPPVQPVDDAVSMIDHPNDEIADEPDSSIVLPLDDHMIDNDSLDQSSHHVPAANSLPSTKTAAQGPRRTVCDSCRKRRIACKHKDVQTAPSREVPQLPFKHNVPFKKRNKACLDCRRNKRRCIHDENGNIDQDKAKEARTSVSTRRSVASTGPGASDSLLSTSMSASASASASASDRETSVQTAEKPPDLSVHTESKVHQTLEQSEDSAVSVPQDMNDGSTIKVEGDQSRNAPMKLPTMTNVKSTTPIKPKPSIDSRIREGSGSKKRKASGSSHQARSTTTSPRTKKFKAEARDDTEQDDQRSMDGSSNHVMSPVAEEEESLRLARELAGESFSLRRRKSVGV